MRCSTYRCWKSDAFYVYQIPGYYAKSLRKMCDKQTGKEVKVLLSNEKISIQLLKIVI